MTSYQRFYFSFFVVAAISCFSPLKFLPYILPFSFILLSQFTSNRVFRLLSLGFSFALYVFLYKLIYDKTFVVQNYILSILTYSPLLTCLFVDYRKLYSKELESKLMRFLLPLLVVESVWGIVQALYGFSKTHSFDVANGDFVEGTIAPGLAAELSFSNVMFVTNMIFILNFLLGHYLKGTLRHKFIFYLTILVIILASVVHSILIYFFAIVVSFLVIRPKIFQVTKSGGRKILMVLTTLAILSFFVLKDNIARIPAALSGASSPELPRAIITYRAFTELPQDVPLQPYFGLGLGQFCSRASLINSGLYLGGPANPKTLPLFNVKKNPVADNYVFSLMEEWAEVTYLGSSNQPYYSFLSIYTETGAIGLLIFLFLVFRLVVIVKQVAKKRAKDSIDCFVFLAGLIYLITLGLQENYYEIAQAIFIGILLLQFLYAKIKYAKEADDT